MVLNKAFMVLFDQRQIVLVIHHRAIGLGAAVFAEVCVSMHRINLRAIAQMKPGDRIKGPPLGILCIQQIASGRCLNQRRSLGCALAHSVHPPHHARDG